MKSLRSRAIVLLLVQILAPSGVLAILARNKPTTREFRAKTQRSEKIRKDAKDATLLPGSVRPCLLEVVLRFAKLWQIRVRLVPLKRQLGIGFQSRFRVAALCRGSRHAQK